MAAVVVDVDCAVGAAWHTLTADETMRRLGTPAAGLAAGEAKQRLQKHGPNELQTAAPIRPWRILLAQFESVLVWLLLVADLLAFLLGEWIDATAILVIVVLNAAIGFAQEFRAEHSILALRRMTAPRARVRRGGAVESLRAADLVPGDIILLEAGDLVPADARLVRTASLRCVEAALTGESEPVDKDPALLADQHAPLGDRASMVWSGTPVVAGAAEGVVVATGMGTEMGKIARLIESAAGDTGTPLQRRLAAFGRVLVLGSGAIVVVLLVLGLVRGDPPAEMLLTAISLAVAAVPEGLPAVVTIALAVGVVRMARRQALVRRLPAVETLGCASVICSDKTGTLTVGEMTVRTLVAGGRAFTVSGEGYGPGGTIRRADGGELDATDRALLDELLDVLVGCNDANLRCEAGTWTVVGDPTEGALLAAGTKLGKARDELEAKRPRICAWPFDSDRKRMSVSCRRPSSSRDGIRVLVKGAPEMVLERCSAVLAPDGVHRLEDRDKVGIEAIQGELSGRGLRVLAAAYRDVDGGASVETADEAERELVFAGLVGMHDPPRAEAKEAVARCRAAGIRVVMITGDHPQTARAVAAELGIPDCGDDALTGRALSDLTDEGLSERVARTAVYARVTAEHKLRIVRAWQARGGVVAMTGDGVNDAPALKGADIGVAMGRTGTEVTKEAADMVVADDNFASIVAAVEEGRGIYENIRKTLIYLLAGNCGEILFMGACIVGGLPVPLLPIHLLWINLVTDGLPALCLATDPIDSGVMGRPPRPRGERLLDRSFLGSVLLTSGMVAALAMGVYLYGLAYEDEATARTHAFAALVFAELLRAFSSRSELKTVFRVGLLSNVRLLVVVAVSFAVQVASHHFDLLRTILRTETLPWSECLALVGVSTVPFFMLEAVKAWRHRST